MLDDGIRPGRIDHCQPLQNPMREKRPLPHRTQIDRRPFHAVDEFLNGRRARLRVHLADRLAEKSVDEAALSRFHLTNHNEQGGRGHRLAPILQERLVFGQPRIASQHDQLVQQRPQGFKLTRQAAANNGAEIAHDR